MAKHGSLVAGFVKYEYLMHVMCVIISEDIKLNYVFVCSSEYYSILDHHVLIKMLNCIPDMKITFFM